MELLSLHVVAICTVPIRAYGHGVGRGSRACGAGRLRTCSVSAADAAHSVPRVGMRSRRSRSNEAEEGDGSGARWLNGPAPTRGGARGTVRGSAGLEESARQAGIGFPLVIPPPPGLRSSRRRADMPGKAGTRSWMPLASTVMRPLMLSGAPGGSGDAARWWVGGWATRPERPKRALALTPKPMLSSGLMRSWMVHGVAAWALQGVAAYST